MPTILRLIDAVAIGMAAHGIVRTIAIAIVEHQISEVWIYTVGIGVTMWWMQRNGDYQ